MSRAGRFIGIAVVIVVIVLGLGLWSKHSADAAATDYYAQRSKVAANYKKLIATVSLSSHVSNGVEDSPQELAAQQANCTTASTLQKQVADLSQASVKSSVGGFLSSSYKQAKQIAKTDAQTASKLQKYADVCNYYMIENHSITEEKMLSDSQEYKSLLDYQGDGCSNGCIRQPNYAAFAVVYQKRVDIDKKYSAQYDVAACPLPANQAQICESVKAYTKAVAEHAQIYVDALKANDKDKVNEESKYEAVSTAFDQLNATVKKVDPASKDINAYWKKLLATQEAAMRSQKV